MQPNNNIEGDSVNQSNLPKETFITPLCKPTPLSKYFALALFVALPFIGGLVGYNLAREKVVEVTQIRVVERTEAEVITTEPEWLTSGLKKPNILIATSSERYTVLAYVREFYVNGTTVVIDPVEDTKPYSDAAGVEYINTSTTTFMFQSSFDLQNRIFGMSQIQLRPMKAEENSIDMSMLNKVFANSGPYLVSIDKEGRVVEIEEQFQS